MARSSPPNTSWEDVSTWYDSLTSEEGHYYHQNLIIPYLLKLLELKKDSSLLDLACGQGVLERALPHEVTYVGVDLSPHLIAQAKKWIKRKNAHFYVGDITKPLPLKKQTFTHATCILAIQNIHDPYLVFKEAHPYLEEGALFVIVMNHPCFRIPRQSSWGIDEEKKLQYRRIDAYMSPLKIPIKAHPSQKEKSQQSLSFHFPLSTYLNFLYKAGFHTLGMEEWTSPKISTGKKARMENRARLEFPLFLALIAEKRKKED